MNTSNGTCERHNLSHRELHFHNREIIIKLYSEQLNGRKKGTFHNCGQKRHITPECPEPTTENDDDKKEDDNKPDKISTNKKLTPKNKSVQFTNVNDPEEENVEEVCASQYNFAFNTNISTSDDLRHLLLLDNQSTCDIFCNSKLLKRAFNTKFNERKREQR